jgi:hypothetical protein
MTNLENKFKSQRNGAAARGIDWQFTYDEWVAWWGDDIKYRGNTKNNLVMARYGDTGPYHPDNVYKAKMYENTAEWSNSDRFKAMMASTEYRDKIKAAWIDPAKNANLKKRCKPLQTPYGRFESQSEAARQLGVTQGTIWHRLKTRPTEYFEENTDA